jgi:hypothetical protein
MIMTAKLPTALRPALLIAGLAISFPVDADAPITDVGGIAVGSSEGAADTALRAQGCSFVSTGRIDDKDAVVISTRYDVEIVRSLIGYQERLPGGSGSPSLSKQVFRCSDGQLIILSTEHDGPNRVAAVTLVYCAADEEEGAKAIYDKLGAHLMASQPNVPSIPIFFSSAVAGEALQQTIGRLSERIDASIYAQAYKKPDGCRASLRPAGYLYGLMLMSTPLMQGAIERDSQFRQRAIDRMKPPRL